MKRDTTKAPEASTLAQYPLFPERSRETSEARYKNQVSQAVMHLLVLRKHRFELEGIGSPNLAGALAANRAEFSKLVAGDPAYRDAAAIILAELQPETK